MIRKKNLKRIELIVLVVVLLFPLLVGGIYALPIRQIIMVDSGDVLAYYGVIIGISSSFYMYISQQKKREKERSKMLKPKFIVSVEKNTNDSDVYNIKVVNTSRQHYFYFFLYDEYVKSGVPDECELNVSYLTTSQFEKKQINVDYNITQENNMIDSDGYPKYVQIVCEDIDGNSWNCCYDKINNMGEVFYYPTVIELI